MVSRPQAALPEWFKILRFGSLADGSNDAIDDWHPVPHRVNGGLSASEGYAAAIQPILSRPMADE